MERQRHHALTLAEAKARFRETTATPPLREMIARRPREAMMVALGLGVLLGVSPKLRRGLAVFGTRMIQSALKQARMLRQ